MKVSITETQYKDQPAVTIESEQLAAQFLPALGGKLCSLLYKPLGREFLVQRPHPQYRIAAYDGDYVADGECSGFDDMFPSIDKCFYESYPWRGTSIPDHGEVWSIPWDWSLANDRLHMKTYGVRFPYQLEKWITFADEGVLRIDYRLTNLSNFDLDFMWAAHPMFYMEEGAQLLLPTQVRQVVTTLSFTGTLGSYGDVHAFPLATLADGQTLDLRRLRPKATRDAYKYFVQGKLSEGWCALTYPQSDLTLALSFPVERVPYLAILPNEGGWQDLYNIFLEPATASFDRLDLARLHHECSTVTAKSLYEWHLNLTIAAGTHHSRVDQRGRLL